MKMIRIDNNAHKLLNKAKDKMREEGIENPTFSDVIRWLYNHAKL
jgi:predicted CopG family antitoxin